MHNRISSGVNHLPTRSSGTAAVAGVSSVQPSVAPSAEPHHQHHTITSHPHSHHTPSSSHHHYINPHSESWLDQERLLKRNLNEAIRLSAINSNKSAASRRYRDVLAFNDLYYNIQRLASNSRSVEQLNNQLIGSLGEGGGGGQPPPWAQFNLVPQPSHLRTSHSAASDAGVQQQQQLSNSQHVTKQHSNNSHVYQQRAASSHQNLPCLGGSTMTATAAAIIAGSAQPSSVKSSRSKIPIKHSKTLSQSGSSSLQFPSMGINNNISSNNNYNQTVPYTTKAASTSYIVNNNNNNNFKTTTETSTSHDNNVTLSQLPIYDMQQCNGTTSVQCNVCILRNVRLNLMQINKAVVAQNETISKLKTKQLRNYFERQMTD